MPIIGFDIPLDEVKEKEREYKEKHGDPNENHVIPDVTTPLEIISREAWGAAPPISKEPLCTPLDKVLILDTGTESCHDTDKCIATVKELQTFYMEKKGLPDIPWNFLVGGDGKVYEGRGWVRKASKLTPETEPLDGKSIDLAYIGDFKATIPPREMSQAAVQLSDRGVARRVLTLDHDLQSEIMADFVEQKKTVANVVNN